MSSSAAATRLRPRQIELVAVRRDERAHTRERFAQRRTDLAGDAGEQDSHQAFP